MASLSDKKRKARFRRRLSYVVAVVVTTIISFFIYTKSNLLPYQVNKYINSHYLADSPFEFTCERIRGDYLHRIVIERPVLRYHAADASFNVFRADRVLIDYRIFDILKLNLVVEDLQLENVGIQIRTGADGKLILPIPETLGDAPSLPSFGPRIDVRQFQVAGLQLFFGGAEHELAVRDVDIVGAFRYSKGHGRLQIAQGNAFVIDTETSISSLHLDLETQGTALSLRDFGVRLDQSAISATGGYEDGVLKRVQLVFNPVSLDELHTLGLFPEASGEFGGNVILDGELDELRLSGTITGTGFGVALNGVSFAGTFTGDSLNIETMKGHVFGTTVDGSFRYALDSEDFWYRGYIGNLDITHGFVPNVGLPVTNLNGHLDLHYQQSTGIFFMDALVDSARIDEYQTYESSFTGLWSPIDGFVVESSTLGRPGYTIDAQGIIDNEGVFNMVLSGHGTDLTYLWDYLKIPHFEGRIAANARVVGPAEDLRINLNGNLWDGSFLGAVVDSGVVNVEILGVGTENPTVQLNLVGSHLRYAGMDFDNPRLFLEVTDGVTSIRELRFQKGDTTIVAGFDIHAEGGEDRVDITVQRLAVRTSSDTWLLRRPGRITWAEGEMFADSMMINSARGVLGITGEYSELNQTSDFSVWGRNVELGLLKDALGVPFQLRGRGDFDFVVTGSVDNPNVDLNLQFANGAIDSVAFDYLHIDAAFDGAAYRLSRGTLSQSGDSLSITGFWLYPRSPIKIFRDGFDRDAATNSTIAARASMRTFSIPAITRSMHLRPVIGGVFSGDLEVSGTLSQPEMRLAGDVLPRRTEGMLLPPTSLSMSYENELVTVDNVSVAGDFNATLSGTVPVAISLIEPIRVKRDETLSASLHIEESELGRLEPYLDAFSRLSGRIEGNLVLSGSLNDPRMNGKISLARGEIKMRALEERFTAVNARVDFVDNLVRLTSLDARSEDEGRIFASGSVGLDGFRPTDYRVDVTLREFWLRSIPDFESLQDGDLKIRSHRWQGEHVIPEITGTFNVHEATIRRSFESNGTVSTLTMPTDDPAWICSIDLNGYKNIWIRNPDLTVEMGGNLILVRDQNGLYLRGDLNVLRGSYNVYANKFRIIDGTLNFSTAVRPAVSINAYTPHRQDDGIERRIYLSLNWPQEQKEPTIQLSYDLAGYSEQDLYLMLGGSIGAGLATNALERVINQQMSGVSIEIDQRAIDRNATSGSAEQEMVVGVGKYLWEDIYLRYRQGLTQSSEQEVQVEYRLSNLFLLRSEYIRNSRRNYIGRNGQYTDEFNLDIKFRWEY